MIEHVNDVYALRPGLFRRGRGAILARRSSSILHLLEFLLCHQAKMRFGEQFSDAKGKLMCD